MTAGHGALAPAGVEAVQGFGGAAQGSNGMGSCHKRALRSDADDATPDGPTQPGRKPGLRRGCQPRTKVAASESQRPHFEPEKDEPAALFGISLPPLAARSVAKGATRVLAAAHRASQG